MTLPLRILSFACILESVVLHVGCGHHQPSDTAKAPTVSATMPTPRLPEIRYATRLSPDRLTSEQLSEIIAAARAHMPDGREIWFVWVDYNKLYEGKRIYTATVYFTPDETSPRLTTGRSLGINSMFYSPDSRRRALAQMGLPEGWLARYAQVSTAGQPFAKGLPIPTGALLPFNPPDGVSDADLVSIVDAARLVHDAKVGFAHADEPICRIELERVPEGEIHVFFGSQEGPLSGSGTLVIVRKTDKGYKADDGLAHWRS